MLTPIMLAEFINSANVGDEIVYHVGLLMNDRQYGENFRRINMTATAAWDAMVEGKVRLVQAKFSPGRYTYGVVKLAEPYVPVKFTGCYSDDLMKISLKSSARRGRPPALRPAA
jgi:hypothetical protein